MGKMATPESASATARWYPLKVSRARTFPSVSTATTASVSRISATGCRPESTTFTSVARPTIGRAIPGMGSIMNTIPTTTSRRAALASLDAALFLAGIPSGRTASGERILTLPNADVRVLAEPTGRFDELEVTITTVAGRSRWWFAPHSHSEQAALELLDLTDALRLAGDDAHRLSSHLTGRRVERLSAATPDVSDRAIAYRVAATRPFVELFEEAPHGGTEHLVGPLGADAGLLEIHDVAVDHVPDLSVPLSRVRPPNQRRLHSVAVLAVPQHPFCTRRRRSVISATLRPR